ncbi:MAG: cytochrome-c peroxidase [Hymenobacter sp.]
MRCYRPISRPRCTRWPRNPPDEATFELGRTLFYDPRLSSDGTISCGSCHQQSRAFTDGRALAVGVGGRLSPRNAPTLQNLRWRRGFMADGGVRGLELQALAPLTSHAEMDLFLADALARLNADPEYRRRFATIYGPGMIDTPSFYGRWRSSRPPSLRLIRATTSTSATRRAVLSTSKKPVRLGYFSGEV